ncbi:CD109 antigen [Trichonephila inaurata madagascariensis]|uniref:CD109 antigen n=1 Tax=Trichonephila inaurata madagascariensis TaxID=2747483 RepID=A0A8X6XFS0_9ARAC|nr:CD109 antigen [Trichonephila inaurata madagascariensis]
MGNWVGRCEGQLSAQRYLEKMLHTVRESKDPYEIAIVSYALTLVNSVDGEAAFNALDAKMRETAGLCYWSREPVPPPLIRIENNRPHLMPRLPHRYDASNVETTAYALLTHVKRQAVIQREIVHWLNGQRTTDHGWASTQIPRAYGTVVVKAQGSGVALVQLSVHYNVDWKHLITQPPLPAFDLDVKASYSGRNNSHITIRSCQSWTRQSESRTSGMAVLEVALPTGYIIEQHELHGYVRSRYVRNLREARFREGQIVFFFEHLDISPICVTFTVQRWHPVANMTQYLPVKVYDYYAPERYNETMLDMYNLFVMNICQVCGSYQCPYCPVFSSAPTLYSSLFVLLLIVWTL